MTQEERQLELQRQLEEEAIALRELDCWPHKDALVRFLKREAYVNQSAFDAAFSDPRFSSDISHGAAFISGMQNLFNSLIINIEQAKSCLIQRQHQPSRRNRRQVRKP
jgi:hypothetical protein